MKLHAWVSTGVMSLLLGASTVVLAQDKNDEVKPPQQEEPKRDEARPERRPEQEPREQNKQEQNKQEQDKREQDKAARQEHPEQKDDQKVEQKDEHARAGKSQRIPDDKFRQHFGREHVVVINRPVIVEGRPRFQASGYWFEIVDPWPVEWAYTDQVYVDYIDGEYFLFDVLHPGVRIALFVTL